MQALGRIVYHQGVDDKEGGKGKEKDWGKGKEEERDKEQEKKRLGEE